MIEYFKTKKGKETLKRYAQSEKGKISGKKRRDKFRQSKRGKEGLIKYQQSQERKKVVDKYKKSPKGKMTESKSKAKRKRNLNWFLMSPNPFSDAEKVDYHHITDAYVVALPKDLHQQYGGKYHRENTMEIVKQIYLGDE